MKRWLIVAVLLAACGGGSKAATSSAQLPSCSSLFADGARITAEQVKAGCMDGSTKRLFATFACTDGRHVVQHGKAWAFVDDIVHTTSVEVADDPGYKAAYSECMRR